MCCRADFEPFFLFHARTTAFSRLLQAGKLSTMVLPIAIIEAIAHLGGLLLLKSCVDRTATALVLQ
jgi:hypothetical protein